MSGFRTLMLYEIPRTEAQEDFVAESRQIIRNIILRTDPRFLLIVGPCSIHDPRAGCEYAARLRGLIDPVRDQVYVVMRCYFEKPRTSIGWKGLIVDPRLDGSHAIPEGLRLARRFLMDVIDLGVPTAAELLDPMTPQYIADLICWSAIGARTTESQTHRQLASGLSMPLGFKNATPGTIAPAVNAVDSVITIRGTEPHVGKSAWLEELIANDLTTSFRNEHRLHNDANILAMGGRIVGPGLALEILDVFLKTEFEWPAQEEAGSY